MFRLEKRGYKLKYNKKNIKKIKIKCLKEILLGINLGDK